MTAPHGSGITRHTRPHLRAMTAGTLVTGMSLALVPVLGGSAAAQSCAQAGNQVVCTFDYTGSAQTFTVPSGVTQLSVDARGASGGAGATGTDPGGAAGGAGARVTGTVTVTPGQTLEVNVGGAGGGGLESTPGSGGFNGGADGGGITDSSSGGGGGGASDVRSGTFDLASRLVTAAGGGGGGGAFQDDEGLAGGTGGPGGQSGTNGNNGTDGLDATGGQGGGGATPTTPGAFGAGGTGDFPGDDGQPGMLGTGGDGGDETLSSGGGGGGGVYGGGGGGGGGQSDVEFAGGGGGGGGSSAGPAGSTFTTGANNGNGLVILTYTLRAPVSTYLKSHPNPSRQWKPVHLSDLVCPTTSGTGVPRPTGTVTFAVDGTPAGTARLKHARHNCGIANHTLKRLAVGVHTITATYSGDANYSSNSGNPERLTQVVKRCRHHWQSPKNGNHGCV